MYCRTCAEDSAGMRREEAGAGENSYILTVDDNFGAYSKCFAIEWYQLSQSILTAQY